MNRLVLLLYLGFLICYSGNSSAMNKSDDLLQQFSLEDLLNIQVEIATKTKEKSSLSPAIMTVITAQEIENYGYQSVPQALSHAAGFVDNYDLAIHNFGVRGINSGARSGSRTIKFMINGQDISFRASSQNFIDQELLPMHFIERIEIIRGPVSALYGANAFLAVINIVTKTGETLGKSGGLLSIKALVNENAGKGAQVSAMVGQKYADWDYALASNFASEDRSGIKLPRRSPAFDDLDNVNSSQNRAKPVSIYGYIGHDDSTTRRFKLTGHYQQLQVDNPFSDINPLPTLGTTTIALDNLHLRSDYQLDFTDGINAKFYAGYRQGGTLKNDKIEVGAERFYLQRRFGYRGIDIGGEVHFSLREDDSLLLGADNQQDHHDIETFTRIDRGQDKHIMLNPKRNEKMTNTGVYLQYLLQITPNWRAIAGIRFDNDSVIGEQISSRIGIVGQLPNEVIVKILAGSAFQAPSSELLYRTAVQAGDIIGNPELNAQRAKTIEIALAQAISRNLHLSVSYFHTQVDDLVVFTSDSSNLFANNSAASTTQGLELELRLLWRGINGYLNYSWQKNKREQSPMSLNVLEHREHGELYPEQNVNFGLSYLWPSSKVRLSLNNRWLDSRPASSSNVLYINQFYKLDPYFDTSLTLSSTAWSLFKNNTTRVQFKINDLFDHNYVNPGFGGIEFPSLGRQFMLTIEQSF